MVSRFPFYSFAILDLERFGLSLWPNISNPEH
jgi:hypothetical protein